MLGESISRPHIVQLIEKVIFCLSKWIILNVKSDSFELQNNLFSKALFCRLKSNPKNALKYP
jgi:hypothetical protein